MPAHDVLVFHFCHLESTFRFFRIQPAEPICKGDEDFGCRPL
jgi:hypothetical protein